MLLKDISLLLNLLVHDYVDSLVHDCSKYIANALELLQPSTKPSKFFIVQWGMYDFVCFCPYQTNNVACNRSN